jgi:hypothetical protein
MNGNIIFKTDRLFQIVIPDLGKPDKYPVNPEPDGYFIMPGPSIGGKGEI